MSLALHAAINARAGIRHGHEPHNALVLLSMIRARGQETLFDYMDTRLSGKHRFWFRRWRRKMLDLGDYMSRYN